jgi:hypothetical protein
MKDSPDSTVTSAFVSFMWTLGPLGASGRQHLVPLTYVIFLQYALNGRLL